MHTLFPAAEVDTVPSWVTHPCFEEAVQQATPATAARVVGTFRRVSAAMRTRIQPELPPESPWKTSTPPPSDVFMPPWAASECVAQRRLVVAAARLALGDAAEATMIYESVQLSRRGSNRLVRVYADAHLVSIWSSAHAEYMAAIQAGEEEPLDPCLFSIPNAAAQTDFSDLFSRRTCPRLTHKGSRPLLDVLCRSTNPGSRGWDTLLQSALTDSIAVRMVLNHAIVVCLTGMHPHMHPILRPPWWVRHQVFSVSNTVLSLNEHKEDLVTTAVATKEAVRRLLASSVGASAATQAALGKLGHPVGLLTTPPVALPPRGLEASMAAFVVAGQRLLTSSPPSYPAAIDHGFSTQRASEFLPWQPTWLGTPFYSNLRNSFIPPRNNYILAPYSFLECNGLHG